MRQSKPSAFSNMNRRRTPPASNTEYRSWKKKEETPKEVNMASFSDFPDLVKTDTKKSVLTGTSLATKLKEVIQAEEEAAVIKRLRKGETQESILRKSYAILSLNKKTKTVGDIPIPPSLSDTSDTLDPVIFPSFKHKSLHQLAKERQLKRYGIHPSRTMLYDIEEPEFLDDKISLPDVSETMYEEEMESPMEEDS